MKPEEFVIGVKKRACDSAVRIVTNELKGTQMGHPSRRAQKARAIYQRLNDEEKQIFADLLAYCTEMVAFGIFVIIDGEGFIEGVGEKSVFKLTASKGSEESILNGPGGDDLHDLLNDLYPPGYAEDEFNPPK